MHNKTLFISLICFVFGLKSAIAQELSFPKKWEGREWVDSREEDWGTTLEFKSLPSTDNEEGLAIMYQYNKKRRLEWVKFAMTVTKIGQNTFEVTHEEVIADRSYTDESWCFGTLTLVWDENNQTLNGKGEYGRLGCADSEVFLKISADTLPNQPKKRLLAQKQKNKPNPILPKIPTSEDSSQTLPTIPLHKVLFELKTDVLLAEAYPELDQLAQELQDAPNIGIRIEGHTDKGYSEQADNQLSLERAEAVKQYLVDKGVSDTRIQTKGFGHSRLLKPAPNPENRRVEFVIIKF